MSTQGKANDVAAPPPKVSVSLVTYNHERFIAQKLAGILAQQRDFDLEIVIGEDSSTDRTRAIIEEYIDRYPGLINLLPTSGNLGASGNSQKVNAACRGEYVAFCDGDDYWTDPTKLREQVALMDARPDLAFCHTLAESFVEEPEGERVLEIRPTRTEFRKDDDGSVLFHHCYVVSSTVVLRRAWMPLIDQDMVDIGVMDWPFFLSLSFKGGIGFIDKVTARYRVHNANSFRLWDFAMKMACNGRMFYYFAARGPKALRPSFLRRGNQFVYSTMASLAWPDAIREGWRLCLKSPSAFAPVAPMIGAMLKYVAMRSYKTVFSGR
jgi:glycosyltransferase involved in cell wall biosynthesis